MCLDKKWAQRISIRCAPREWGLRICRLVNAVYLPLNSLSFCRKRGHDLRRIKTEEDPFELIGASSFFEVDTATSDCLWYPIQMCFDLFRLETTWNVFCLDIVFYKGIGIFSYELNNPVFSIVADSQAKGIAFPSVTGHLSQATHWISRLFLQVVSYTQDITSFLKQFVFLSALNYHTIIFLSTTEKSISPH